MDVNKCTIIVLLLLAVVEDVEQIYKLYWKRANGRKKSWTEWKTWAKNHCNVQKKCGTKESRIILGMCCRCFLFHLSELVHVSVKILHFFSVLFYTLFQQPNIPIFSSLILQSALVLALFAASFMHTIQFNLSLVINKTMSTAEKYARISLSADGLDNERKW